MVDPERRSGYRRGEMADGSIPGRPGAVAAPLPPDNDDCRACTSTRSFWAALFILTSNLATHALKSTWENTRGMAVTRPRAVANRARPMEELWAAASACASPIFWKV